MNLIISLLAGIVSFVRRNPIFCLVVVILAVGAPSLLAGIASAVFYIICAIVVAMLILGLVLRRKIRRMQREFTEAQYTDSTGSGAGREGEVRIRMDGGRTGKRINDGVGDYVDFEEEKYS